MTRSTARRRAALASAGRDVPEVGAFIATVDRGDAIDPEGRRQAWRRAKEAVDRAGDPDLDVAFEAFTGTFEATV